MEFSLNQIVWRLHELFVKWYVWKEYQVSFCMESLTNIRSRTKATKISPNTHRMKVNNGKYNIIYYKQYVKKNIRDFYTCGDDMPCFCHQKREFQAFSALCFPFGCSVCFVFTLLRQIPRCFFNFSYCHGFLENREIFNTFSWIRVSNKFRKALYHLKYNGIGWHGVSSTIRVMWFWFPQV